MEQDREYDALLQDYLIHKNEFELVLLTILPQLLVPLRLVSLRRWSHLFWWRGASVLPEPSWGLVNKVAWSARSSTAALFLDPQYEPILLWIYFDNPSRKNSIDYIINIHSVASRRLVSQCVCKLCRQFMRWLGKTHYIGVCFWYFMVLFVGFKQIVDSPAVRIDRALLLRSIRLSFQYDACVKRCRSRYLVINYKSQRAAPSCTSHVSQANIKSNRKLAIEI